MKAACALTLILIAAFAALVMIAPIGTAHAGQMTYTPTTGGKTVTEKSVSIPLRILGPLYQTAANRCDATPIALNRAMRFLRVSISAEQRCCNLSR
jgi:hypothetical protein